MRKIKLQSWELTDAERRLAEIGRAMMDRAAREPDDAVCNHLSEVGYKLCAYNSPYGTTEKDFTAEDRALIKSFLETA